MRGKVKPFLCPLCHKGITPAYAGKSLFTFRKVMRLRDHPRLCGEKYSVYFLPLYGIGSPPPMRGKVLGLSNRCQSSWDHPRLCGEKQLVFCNFFRLLGSPPPMRGKAVSSLVSSTLSRITPALSLIHI